jgi:hypothetical protein
VTLVLIGTAFSCLVWWLWLTRPPSRDYEQGLVMRISRVATSVVVVAVLVYSFSRL